MNLKSILKPDHLATSRPVPASRSVCSKESHAYFARRTCCLTISPFFCRSFTVKNVGFRALTSEPVACDAVCLASAAVFYAAIVMAVSKWLLNEFTMLMKSFF